MKPQQYVIALSSPGRRGDTVRTLDLAGEPPFAGPMRAARGTRPPPHKFDCSNEELEWLLRIARAGV